MANADLHVHSKYSNHPSEWFLQRIGASESYTEPEDIYNIARKNGMTFVTITDHNTIDGALELVKKHPKDCFVSVEATAYFPEDNCKVHILVYNITKEQFDSIQALRSDIYQLRDFIRKEKLACSVAHGIYSVNNRLTVDHVEKLILLFDTFEIMNGSRSRMNNQPLADVLKNLTKETTDSLIEKHRIEPFSDTPWIKGFTGGSDDHSGLFIGKAFTKAQGNSVEVFVDNLKSRHSMANGRYSNYQSLAFAIYKIAYEFSRKKSSTFSKSFASQLTEKLFSSDSLDLKSKLKIKTYSTLKRREGSKSVFEDLYWDLFTHVTNNGHASTEDKLDSFYDKLSIICDEFFKQLMGSFTKSLEHGDIFGLLKNVSSSLPGVFLTIPFFSTQKHFSNSRTLIRDLKNSFGINGSSGNGKILWFTDTITDLNGVSMIIKKIGWLSSVKDRDVTIVTSIPEDEMTDDLPPNVVNIPHFYTSELPRYENLTVHFPSLMTGLKMLDEYEPDMIYISTPGPVGLFGMLMSKVMNAKSIGVYHTDFTLQARDLFDDSTIENLIESYIRWFYSMLDEIRVPTKEYIDILDRRSYDREKMSVFRRGIDTALFSPAGGNGSYLGKLCGIKGGFTLLYAGRISRDKNLEFLIDVYNSLAVEYPELNLLIAGDGPDMASLKAVSAGNNRLVFTGALRHDSLPRLYSAADLFVFPSTTDTYGMVVMEAQSCGLPAIVTDKGGPKELVVENETGFVLGDTDKEAWMKKITELIELKKQDPGAFKTLKTNSRRHVLENANWDVLLDELTTVG